MAELIDARFVAFIGVAAVLIATPGPDMALVTRNVLGGGRRAGTFTALGVGIGVVGWAAAAALGIAGLLDRSAAAFHALKLAGAAYLVFLGVRALLGGRGEHSEDGAGKFGRVGRLGDRAALRQGALGNLLNPKAGVIFLSIFPQFVEPGDTAWRLLAMLMAFEVMIVGWLVFYAAAVSRVDRSRAGQSARRAIAWVTGVVLIALGMRLAIERR
jgi:threonine/homoserine/homoserine lactone efflux protein